MTIDQIIGALTTMIVMYDPAGMAAIFLGVTAGMNGTQRIQVALRSCIIAFFILVIFALFGAKILNSLGISLDSFRIAGGLLLFWIAFEMLFGKRQERHEQTAETAITKDHIVNIAVFPMAIPLIAGPGAISAVILLAGSYSGTQEMSMLVGVIFIATIILLIALIIAERLNKYLGTTGRTILTKLLGLLLAALSVQFVIDGIQSIWPV